MLQKSAGLLYIIDAVLISCLKTNLSHDKIFCVTTIKESENHTHGRTNINTLTVRSSVFPKDFFETSAEVPLILTRKATRDLIL